MKAVILAAGIASRLRPLTADCPKCLLEIGGRSLLQRSVDGLISQGICEVVIVTGYLHEQIEQFLRSQYADRVKIALIHNDRYATTNNIFSLWLTRAETEGEEIILLDSDIVYDPRIIGRLMSSRYDDVLALNNHPLGEEEIKVIPDREGRVKAISKECSIREAVGESIGIERMSPAYTKQLFGVLEQMILHEGLDNVFYERAFERLIGQGYAMGIEDVTDLFSVELDTVDDFKSAQKLIPQELY